MKRIIVPMLMAALALLFAAPAFVAEMACPDSLVMDHYKADTNNLKVEFNHSTHLDYACTECHHTWDEAGGEDPKSCASPGCHDAMDKRDKTEHSYYKAIHNMRAEEIQSCVSCHRDAAGDDREKKKELAGCRGSVCHP
jgi:hypothetical protein